ncbi:DUF3179 domain-containing protein [Candidatus Rariloculus sp.]|uniref:DUF3179 domain-containing protein n=1 Tax=Candidatus Rariloculus sp. TaxID=3101265 RepID=UPI003D11B203
MSKCGRNLSPAWPRLVAAAMLMIGASIGSWAQAQQAEPDISLFFATAEPDEERAAAARQQIAGQWRDGYAGMIVDLLDYLRRSSLLQPQSWIRLNQLAQFLGEQTGQEFGLDVDAWHQWLWSQAYEPHPEYETFKGLLYSRIDRRFEQFFGAPGETEIRLDEIQWGGVTVNGIPPLDHPDYIDAADADYLDDFNIVFGMSFGGESRAYPKRILAWHELALDRIGDRELTIVYCTLCGTVIPYDSTVGGELRVFGTSGLLYQSNKLMFDAETLSLWSSLTGEPVVGPLVGSGLRLTALPVVTTTWGEWRREHPDTTVLSLETGHVRDYSEGAAYRGYFATDALMFDVSRRDARLLNKAEVLVFRFADPSIRPTAVSADFLLEQPIYELEMEGTRLVVVTSLAGANRVYASDEYRFDSLDERGRVIDDMGRVWLVGEDALRASFDDGIALPRVPAHRAFWFGWYAQYPETVLIR